MTNQRYLNSILIVGVAYVAAQMMSDISSLRIIMLAGFSIDAGTLVYPLTFTLRDLVHKLTNIRAARTLVITAGVINIIMAGLFWLVGKLPADLGVGPQEEFVFVLSPVWRIVFASIAAEILSELVDSEVYQQWVNRVGEKWQWGRVLTSNAVAIPFDSLIFVSIAFLGVLPLAVVISIFWANVIIKGITTVLSIPLIYVIPAEKLRGEE